MGINSCIKPVVAPEGAVRNPINSDAETTSLRNK